MIEQLAIAALKDIVTFLKKQPDFLDSTAKEKLDILKSNHTLSSPFKNYLAALDQKTFPKDIRKTVDFLKKKLSHKSALIEALGIYCILELPAFIENAGSETSPKTHLEKSLKEIIKHSSIQEITLSVNNFLSGFKQKSYIIIQSPTEIPQKLRQTIRQKLLQKFPVSFPVFQINSELIGGLRLFVNGRVQDHSWLSQINRINKLE